MEQFAFHDMTLNWLQGGVTNLDGGTMFGVVPKPVWSKKYAVNELNQIELPTDPILISYMGKHLLIDSGMGNGKLTDKQKRNYGVTDDSHIKESLKKLDLTVDDIDYLLMTHLHFDHACGLSEPVDGVMKSVFPNATIIVSEIEWNEMREPNIRSKNTYWKENWEPIQGQVQTFKDRIEILPGIEMIHTGGHSEGHSVVKLTQNGETILHMGDIMPTHAHQNPLWVLAFDDYPMTSVFAKERLMKEGLANGYWFSFYHDAFYRLIKWDEEGKNVLGELKRKKAAEVL